MTTEQIRNKTRELHAKTRRTLLSGMAVPVFLAAIPGWLLVTLQAGPWLQVFFVLAVAWSLTGQLMLNRGMWSATQPEPEALSPGLVSYRREVQRQRFLSGRFLLWSLGPAILAVAIIVVPVVSVGIERGRLISVTPFLALVLVWIVGVIIIRLRDRRELQREIDQLNETEKANPA